MTGQSVLERVITVYVTVIKEGIISRKLALKCSVTVTDTGYANTHTFTESADMHNQQYQSIPNVHIYLLSKLHNLA